MTISRKQTSLPQVKEEPLRFNPDGSLVLIEPRSWFVCFVPPIDKQWWHPFFHRIHKHVFALRLERNGERTIFEPWWTRILVATITTHQALKFLRWGRMGDVLLLREDVPGHSGQVRGWMSCGALVAHMLGRTYCVWTPHQLYRRLIREPHVCRIDVSALLKYDLEKLASHSSVISPCDACGPNRCVRPQGAAKPFCMKCGRDLCRNGLEVQAE